MIPVWPLLFGIAAVTPIVFGFQAGRASGVGATAGLLVGFGVGAGWLVGLLAGRRFYLRKRRAPSEFELGCLYFLLLLSSFASGAIADRATRLVESALSPTKDAAKAERLPRPFVTGDA